ncbi:hypothetical protein CVT26_008888 [Gymnopilus dilepis]|uniref:Chitin synthase n=1 Tax=Gymnopilus dilepis TaxID=231916 RepID=A0A409YB00_9AGAR|nr:hypothetical protein CVT26_008888 [Gymnopilus dilepis]
MRKNTLPLVRDEDVDMRQSKETFQKEKSVIKNIADLCQRSRSKAWGTEGWKKVFVCVVSDGRNKVNKLALQVLNLMRSRRWDAEGIAKDSVGGNDVTLAGLMSRPVPVLPQGTEQEEAQQSSMLLQRLWTALDPTSVSCWILALNRHLGLRALEMHILPFFSLMICFSSGPHAQALTSTRTLVVPTQTHGRAVPLPKSSASSTSSYAASISSSAFTLSPTTDGSSASFTLSPATDGSSASSALFKGWPKGQGTENSVISIQLKRLYRFIINPEAKIKQGPRSVSLKTPSTPEMLKGKEIANEDLEKDKWQKQIDDPRHWPRSYIICTRSRSRLLCRLRCETSPQNTTSSSDYGRTPPTNSLNFIFCTDLIEEPTLKPFKSGWLEALGDLARFLVKSTTTLHPFLSSRESVLPIWSLTEQTRGSALDARALELFVLLHGMVFTNIELDDFQPTLARFIERLKIEGAEEREWIMMGVVDVSSVLDSEYGRPNGLLRRLGCVGPKEVNGPQVDAAMRVVAKKAAAGVPGSSSTTIVADTATETATETTTMDVDEEHKGGDRSQPMNSNYHQISTYSGSTSQYSYGSEQKKRSRNACQTEVTEEATVVDDGPVVKVPRVGAQTQPSEPLKKRPRNARQTEVMKEVIVVDDDAVVNPPRVQRYSIRKKGSPS